MERPEQNTKGNTHLRVFNPSQAKHGWQSTHSIIEVIQPDMPFLVDSVGMALNRMGITAHMMLHTPLAIERSESGVTNVTYLNQSPESTEHVAVFLIEIDRQSSTVDIKALEREIQSVLADVASSVNDWEVMSAKLAEMIKELPNVRSRAISKS